MTIFEALAASKPMGIGGLRQAAYRVPGKEGRVYTLAHVSKSGTICINLRLYSKSGQTFHAQIVERCGAGVDGWTPDEPVAA